MESAQATRERMIEVASALLEEGGVEAVSTRSVATAAGVQPPAIYRLFGDKEGLLQAVAEAAVGTYLLDKAGLERVGDPVEDLRRAWDLHIGFGLTRSAAYTLVFARPLTGTAGAAGQRATAILRELVARAADAGRLRISVDRATRLLHANSVGVVLELLSQPPGTRDLELAVLARETVLAAVSVTDGRPPVPATDLPTRALALREALRSTDARPPLTTAENALMSEWLNRIADHSDPDAE